MKFFGSKRKQSTPNVVTKIEPGPPYPGFSLMRFDELRHLVKNIRFEMSQIDSYEVSDVDAAIDQLHTCLSGTHLSESARGAILELVSNHHFRRGNRIGYNLSDVDNFLTKVTSYLT